MVDLFHTYNDVMILKALQFTLTHALTFLLQQLKLRHQ